MVKAVSVESGECSGPESGISTMNEPHDPNVTADIPADSLDAGLIGALDRPADPAGTTDRALPR
jgi:hypothetical protein